MFLLMNYISYQYSIYQYEVGWAHGNSSQGGASFRKTDGRIIDWGMFRNDGDMQNLIKNGLKEYFGEDRFEDDHIPFPKGYPILLSHGVKFVYATSEIKNSSYADGEPQFTISYSKIKNLMYPSLRELME